MEWKDLETVLLTKMGWSHRRGDGLVDYYYVVPELRDLTKAEVKREGVRGVHYFAGVEGLRSHCRERYGWEGPGGTAVPPPRGDDGKDGRGGARGESVGAAAADDGKAAKEKGRDSPRRSAAGAGGAARRRRLRSTRRAGAAAPPLPRVLLPVVGPSRTVDVPPAAERRGDRRRRG